MRKMLETWNSYEKFLSNSKNCGSYKNLEPLSKSEKFREKDSFHVIHI